MARERGIARAADGHDQEPPRKGSHLEALIDAAFPLLRATVPCDFASAFYRRAGNGLLKSRDSGEFPVFVASVNRSDGTSDFSKREIASLDRVHPFLDCAVTRLHEHEAARNVVDGIPSRAALVAVLRAGATRRPSVKLRG